MSAQPSGEAVALVTAALRADVALALADWQGIDITDEQRAADAATEQLFAYLTTLEQPAPVCNRCRSPLDDGAHTSTVNGWHCKRQMRVGGQSLVTTPGAESFPPRCNGAVEGITDRGCVRPFKHTGDCR